MIAGTDDENQDFNYLQNWGPRFNALAAMYVHDKAKSKQQPTQVGLAPPLDNAAGSGAGPGGGGLATTTATTVTAAILTTATTTTLATATATASTTGETGKVVL